MLISLIRNGAKELSSYYYIHISVQDGDDGLTCEIPLPERSTIHIRQIFSLVMDYDLLVSDSQGYSKFEYKNIYIY